MNVLVVGGTGFVGTALCIELAERGHDVTAFARDPSGASLPESVDAVAGDVTEYGSVAPAVAGRDAVVNLVALSPLFRPSGGGDAHDRVHRGGTENVVEAAEAHGADRLVQMSALGADPEGPTAYLRAKGRAEEVVRRSGLDWTIVRPSVVFGDGGEFVGFTRLLTTPYVTGLPGGGGETRFQPVWIGDLAPMLAATVEADRHAGETYEIGGPEVLTLAEVARAVYRADGKSLRVLPVPMVLARVGLTAAEYLPGVPFGADQYRSLRLDNAVDDNDVTAFGRDPQSLRTFEAYLRGDADTAVAAGDGGSEPGEPTPPDADERADAPDERGSLFVAPPVLAVFAFLTAAWSLQYVVDIYVHPVVRWTFVVPYVVTLFLYDNGIAESVVYAVEPWVPIPGEVLWEVGNLLTYYAVALVAGAAWRLAGRVVGGEDGDRGAGGSAAQ